MEGETVSTATATVHGRHRQVSRWARWSRGRRASVVAVVLLIAVAVVAVALVLFRAPIGGNVASSDTGLEWNTTAAADAVGDGATCALTVASPALANIAMTNAYPGSSCAFQGFVRTKAGADEPVVITGLVLDGLPAGWTVELAAGECGQPVETVAHGVSFTVTMTEAAVVGSAGTISAASSGVEAVPASQYTAAMCP
jgi:hypothetical protein